MRILLVADTRNWAWDYKAKALIKHLPQYDMTRIFAHGYRLSMRKNYDAILFFGWSEARGKLEDLFTGISSYNHQLLHPKESTVAIPRFKGVATVSKQLYEKICKVRPVESTYLCQNGVDDKIFFPQPKPRGDKFVIGWVGRGLHPRATLKSGPFDMKGARFVLSPLREKLAEYNDIELRVHNKSSKNGVPLEEMPAFYHGIDMLLNTSFREGTPNPAFEASACGKPVVGPRVGCLPELIENGVNGFLVDSYDDEQQAGQRVDDFMKHILLLKDNREMCEEMGKANHKIVEEKWTWTERAKAYIPMFENLPNPNV